MFHEHGWILKRAEHSSNRLAIVDVHTEERWTYKTLKERILRWVTFFHEQDCRKGERIAVYAQNCPELFAILFACELQGLIYVPLNWRLSRCELQLLLADCTPKIVLYHSDYTKLMQDLDVKQSILISAVEDVSILEEKGFRPEKIAGTDPWMIIYTGGTTGLPKGVVLSRNSINWNAINTITSWGLSEKDTTINYMPLFHTGGINALSIPILMAGGTIVVGHEFNPTEALVATDLYKATISLFVPTMYQAMIQTAYFSQSTFPSMDVFISGGAPCPESIYRSFQEKGLRFKEGYGLTEAGPNNFYIRPEEACPKIGSVGKAMLFNDTQVLNQQGEQCEINEIGELFLRGPHVFSAYWNRPIETAEVLQDGWLRTGDLAKVDHENDYYIVGRKKDMIITGGENVYPQEVEQCINRFDGIREVAVVGIKDGKWGERVVAFVSRVEEIDLNHESLLIHCKQFLASYKVPKEIIVLPELPKTHVGKIDKNVLQNVIHT